MGLVAWSLNCRTAGDYWERGCCWTCRHLPALLWLRQPAQRWGVCSGDVPLYGCSDGPGSLAGSFGDAYAGAQRDPERALGMERGGAEPPSSGLHQRGPDECVQGSKRRHWFMHLALNQKLGKQAINHGAEEHRSYCPGLGKLWEGSI